MKRNKEIVKLIQDLHKEFPEMIKHELYCLAVVRGYDGSHIKLMRLADRLKIFPKLKLVSESERRERIIQDAHLYDPAHEYEDIVKEYGKPIVNSISGEFPDNPFKIRES